jgi:hypothetical protein
MHETTETAEIHHVGTENLKTKRGDIERMHAAWSKSVLLTISLWSRPYVSGGLW